MNDAPASESVLQTLMTWIAVQGINILVGIVILCVGWWAAGRVYAWIRVWIAKSNRLDPIVESFLASLIYYGLLALLVIISLNLMGVQTTSLIAVLGAASLAIGLALQGSLTSLAAGVMIIMMRPFKTGDYIEVSGEAGTVKSITLFLTELATYDNVQKLLPNSQVWGATVTNYSVYPTRMLDIEVSIDYGDSIDAALETLRNIADREEKVHAEPAPNAFVSGLGDSSVDLTLRIWLAASDYWEMKRALTKRAKEEIEASGLSIPFPHRQIVAVKGDAPPVGKDQPTDRRPGDETENAA
ncbi:mechanosensitive ion channel family protein [Acuticoccus sp. M5D2P5]|uniref:mechanosensitive ion channel family protein n=1 Tax=Acuticoccus kalidii TaxID=2910977 RepID=UPI001F43B7EE|nr:mechanosensitive ion channel family protein [Acuticoccus kalidii]MCF3933569.1 mechanosensitive ion channel family protein [Acuticoccus kalidii]